MLRHGSGVSVCSVVVFVFFSKLRAPRPGSHAERRRSVRHTAVAQIAKIELPSGREELCLLRDISCEGVRAETYAKVASDDALLIELRSGQKVSGRVSWCNDGQFGLVFDEPVPIADVLTHCSFDDRVSNIRPPRLEVDLFGILHVGNAQRVVRIGNVSQAGMQIGMPEEVEAGTPCAIGLPGLAPRPALVRWCRDRRAGLQLEEPFDYATFAEWRTAIAA
jgi:hypothetical protein